MMKRSRWSLGVLCVAAALPVAAQDAFTTTTVDVHAGPSNEYPQVAILAPNTEVHVAGCLSDWSWCDVDFPNDRGWVYARDLAYPFENDRVVIAEYGPRLGLPVLSFSLTAYWDEHYRNRPWFAQRDDWGRRVTVQGGGPERRDDNAMRERDRNAVAPPNNGKAEDTNRAPQAGRPAEAGRAGGMTRGGDERAAARAGEARTDHQNAPPSPANADAAHAQHPGDAEHGPGAPAAGEQRSDRDNRSGAQ